mmetsp:Transcript_71107/g.170322  ORF Transcript_71107/g.170322 Transcript_71107/m.170322 type:complete len:247 (+) Transcript_71107:135-875(+)
MKIHSNQTMPIRPSLGIPGPSDGRTTTISAVKQDGLALQYATEEQRKDREIVKAAVAQFGGALVWAAPALQEDHEIVRLAVSQWGGALVHAKKLQHDRDIVMAAVAQSGEALVYAAPELCSDAEVVLEAVKQYGGALELASRELQCDDKFLERAAAAMDPRYIVFKVAMISGHSCVIVKDTERRTDMREILDFCKPRLGLRSVEGAELVMGTSVLPKEGLLIGNYPGAQTGRVNELLLVLQPSQRQ